MSSATRIKSIEETGESPVRHALRRLSVYILRNWRYYLVWLFVVLAYVASFVLFPVAVGWAIQGVIDPNVSREEVVQRCVVLFGVAVFRGSVRYFSRFLVFDAAREVEYEIRNDLFEHLQKLPQSFYVNWRTGDLMSRCVNDLNQVRMLLGPGLLSVAQSPILFLGSFAVMMTLSPKLAILVMLPYPLFLVITRVMGAVVYRRSLETQKSLASLSNFVQEGIAGISVVKAYSMERDQEARFAEANDELRDQQLSLVRANASFPAITSVLPALGLGFVIIVGLAEIAAGRIDVGTFFAFTMYARDLTMPTYIMGWAITLVQRGSSAMQRIDEVLSTEPSIADRDDCEPIDSLTGQIEFRNLSFRYSAADSEWALEGIDLKVPSGSSLGIVGRVGSGKTTLASMIPRLFEVDDGQIFLDDTDINRIPLTTLRSSIAMVPQDSFLFSMPLFDNVAYGLPPDASLDQVHAASERAQLARDVEDLPSGYSTLVGERGVMLSGGQRQRTALARALALDPKILILDDTLSAVDAETEQRIQAGLGEVFEGRTVVVVASRVSSVRQLDQIAVLDGGQIVEVGTHDELMMRGGLYSRLASEEKDDAERSRLEAQLADAPPPTPAAAAGIRERS